MTNTNFALVDLNTLKAEELKKLAKEHQVKNWWLMKKTDLISALSEIQAEAQEEEHLTPDDIDDLISQAQEELGLGKEIPQKESPKKVKAPRVEKDQNNLVTIKELADEFNMKGTKARRLLRNESALRPFGSNRWEWDKALHNKELTQVKEILKAHSK